MATTRCPALCARAAGLEEGLHDASMVHHVKGCLTLVGDRFHESGMQRVQLPEGLTFELNLEKEED